MWKMSEPLGRIVWRSKQLGLPSKEFIEFTPSNFEKAALEIYRASILAQGIGNKWENIWPELKKRILGDE